MCFVLQNVVHPAEAAGLKDIIQWGQGESDDSFGRSYYPTEGLLVLCGVSIPCSGTVCDEVVKVFKQFGMQVGL